MGTYVEKNDIKVTLIRTRDEENRVFPPPLTVILMRKTVTMVRRAVSFSAPTTLTTSLATSLP